MSVQITTYQNLADKQRKGYVAVSLDSLVATTAVTIKAGSEIEVAGSLYEFQADETESGGTWAAIGNSNVVYLYIVPAGSTATFIYSTTVPTWDLAKQGWYNGTSRAVASLYKDAGGLYQQKYILPPWVQAPVGQTRDVVKTSGALGTLSVTRDTEYFLSAASTATLPASAPLGCQITFKNKGNFTSTINGTIGTTGSTSFSLYAQEDYVTFEWDGVSIWYVKATNGPVLSSIQTAATFAGATFTWTAIGNGLSLGTLPPGVYDIDLEACGTTAITYISLAIGNGLTPISNIAHQAGAAATEQFPLVAFVKGYILTAGATIQGIFYTSNISYGISYDATMNVGRITARRIG